MRHQWENSRNVTERIFITGTLKLDTPTHLGNGEAEAVTDIPLMRDNVEPTKPLLTGSSIAGALRAYLREWEAGCGKGESGMGAMRCERLFGHVREDPDQPASVESWLMVDDARGELPKDAATEIRDGVAIDSFTGAAEVEKKDGKVKGKKFDIELLPAGTSFDIQIEFWKTEKNADLLPYLAAALDGLQKGEIGLGMRKRRGYGQCSVERWNVRRCPMGTKDGLMAWLREKGGIETGGIDIYKCLNVASPSEGSKRRALHIETTFEVNGSLLIRSDGGGGEDADIVYLQSYRNGKLKPVVSGTSLAGALRGRALKIMNTIKGPDIASKMIDGMFGRRNNNKNRKDKPSGSRVIIREAELENESGILDQVHTRVKIDRFTGGSYPQALFSEQPLFSTKEIPACFKLKLELLDHPNTENFDAEMGLILMLLKDLWLEDLPIGGEGSVGRGRLKGVNAVITLDEKKWFIRQQDGHLVMEEGQPGELEIFAEKLQEVA